MAAISPCPSPKYRPKIYFGTIFGNDRGAVWGREPNLEELTVRISVKKDRGKIFMFVNFKKHLKNHNNSSLQPAKEKPYDYKTSL